MSWVRIDDSYTDHPKIVSLGQDMACGIALHVAALCYASRHLTDGFVPAAQVGRLVVLPHRVSADEIAKKLVLNGLWTEAKGGYAIHDYLAYNPSREKVTGERQAAKDRRERARQAAKDRRERDENENVGRTSGDATRDVRANVGRTSGDVQASARAHTPTPTRPDPYPSPRTSYEEGSTRPTSSRGARGDRVVDPSDPGVDSLELAGIEL